MDDMVALPPTLIQIDIHVLIKVVNSWSCFDNIAQVVKDLYLCGIIYLSTLESLEEFREIVISMLSLCQSPNQNKEIERRRLDLWTKLTSDTIQKINREYLTLATGKNSTRSFAFYDIRHNPVISESPHDIYEYINQLKLIAFDMCNFHTDSPEVANEYYCPIILENLIQLLIEFPSWTKIFVKKRDNATLVSTCAIRHLNTLTELKEPVSPPQFFMYHHEKLSALMHQGRFSINKLKNKIGVSERRSRNTQNHAHLSQVFNSNHTLLTTTTITTINANSNSLSNGNVNVARTTRDNHVDSSFPLETVSCEITLPTHRALDEFSEPNTNAVLAADAPPLANSNSTELDLLDLKSAVNSVIRSLLDFDDYVSYVLLPLVKPSLEPAICKTLLDCCTDMKTYDCFIGHIVERFCAVGERFASAFKTLFIESYKTADSMSKNKLKNASCLFAHLLEKDAISWDCFNVVKINERDTTLPKQNFVKTLLRELADKMSAVGLEERFKDKEYKMAYKGLFPIDSRKDAAFAASFYKSIGLRGLGSMLNVTIKKAPAPQKTVVKSPIQKRSPSVSSTASESSCDFVFELRVKKKNGKKCSSQKRKLLDV